MWKNFTDAFYLNFISDDRWHYIADGLKTTLIITFFACMMGIVLGFIVGMIRSTHDKTGNLKLLNILCKIYLTVIRGTPVVVQLLIIYFVVFGSTRIDKVPVAIMAFGINSGAYVAEIFRSGIMSIDPGQMEAGRSLGFNYAQTMWYVIMPQAFKTVLPTLCNEFISLLKGFFRNYPFLCFPTYLSFASNKRFLQRPYIVRFIIFNRLFVPSTKPLL